MFNQLNQVHIQSNRRMPNNSINTAQYTVWNFVPKNLLNQFKKAPNVYFALITYLQTVNEITISAGQPVMALPLAAVVFVSMLKDAFEDYKRHKSDDQENNTVAEVFNAQTQNFEPRNWKDIHVGEIIKIKDETFCPCDVLLLASSDPKGTCYVETKNLDGETNLKIKGVHKDFNTHFSQPRQLANMDGQLMCETPNGALYKFEGQALIAQKNEKIPINPENVLLRGSSMRNTEYVYGISVFTGHDTKVMKNSTSSKYKFSKLEILVNKSMVIVFCLQCILALIAAIFGTSFQSQNDKGNNDGAAYMFFT